MTEQGYPPRRPDQRRPQERQPDQYRPDQYGRSGWSRIPQEPRRSGWRRLDEFDPGAEPEDELPPWAGPGVRPVRGARRPPAVAVVDAPADPPDSPLVSEPPEDATLSPGRPVRGVGRAGRDPGRAAATRRRRFRRRLLTVGSVIAVIAIVALAVTYLSQPATSTGGPVMTLQRGEYSKVPDACRAVPASLLTRFLGAASTSLRPQPGECTFTVDAKTRFRQLDVTIEALQPNAGYGDGSATANATYAFARERAQLRRPPKSAPQPPATITPVPGVGNAAFVAVLVFHVGAGTSTNKVILMVRYKNVLISTSMQGDAHRGGGASGQQDDLQAGVRAIARTLLSVVKAEPAVG